MDILRVNFNIGYVSQMSDLPILSSSLYLRNLIAIQPLLSNARGDQLSRIYAPRLVSSLVASIKSVIRLSSVRQPLFKVWVGWKPMYRPFRHPVNLQLARQKIKNRQPLFRVTFTRPSLDRQPVYGLTVGLRSVEVPGG